MRRRLTGRHLTAILIVTALCGGLVLGLIGGRVERDGAATTLAGLVLVIAGVQLVHIWRA